MNAINPFSSRQRARQSGRAQGGMSLIELMISIGISMVLVAGLSAMLVNVSRTNTELAKANAQIENGRFAVQLIESELVHAGFWGGFVPQFDDVNWSAAPRDTPTAIPDPCLAYPSTGWTPAHMNNLVGIVLHSSDVAPGDCVLDNKMASTDVLVVRHADTCIIGAAGCDAEVAGKMYFQASRCAGGTTGTARSGSTSTTLNLAVPTAKGTTSITKNAYVGMTIELTGGTGMGQSRVVTGFNEVTSTATVNPAWVTTPTVTTTYAIAEDLLSTTGLNLRKRGTDCALAPVADLRKFVSHIYFIRDYAQSVGDGIPTLVRSEYDPGATVALAHQTPQALVEGVEGFAVELGIDNKVTRCDLDTDVAYGEIAKVDPLTCAEVKTAEDNTLPTNRGDGNPDEFRRCTTATPCTAAHLTNVVAAKVYLLVRNTEASGGYKDGKTYCLGARNAGGICPTGSSFGPYNDGFKRHMFTTTVRLTNVSGRRETPK